MGTLANSKDQDKMMHNVAFQQGLHYDGRSVNSGTNKPPYHMVVRNSLKLW